MAFCSAESGISVQSRAVLTLASAVEPEITPTPDFIEQCLSAVDVLKSAPPLLRWDKGLFFGLRRGNPEIVARTIDACIYRLKHAPDAESRDRFLGALLDECFVNLYGGLKQIRYAVQPEDRESGGVNRESASARLLNAVSVYLAENPLELEHHRSRFLSRARRILHMEGGGEIARSVIHFQKALAGEGNRSDNLTTEALRRRRKYETYAAAGSAEPALLAYLDKDSPAGAEDVSRDVFRMYRVMLNRRNRERSPSAVLKAFHNLEVWMASLSPFDPDDREHLLEESNRASAGVPWETLSPIPRKHLESCAELLPGPDHPEDLLNLIRSRYGAEDAEAYLIAGLSMLKQTPLIRFRASEPIRMLTDTSRRRRGEKVWDALLDLLASSATGLLDFTASGESDTPRLRKRNKAMKSLLKTDKEIRDALYRVSVNTSLSISHDAELGRRIREKAWRSLLSLSPWNRRSLYKEGILDHERRLFTATLEAAGALNQRDAWEFIEADADGLFTYFNEQGPDRMARILADYFEQTGDYSAISGSGRESGIMIRLVFESETSDSPDNPPGTIRLTEETRRYVAEKMVQAGYGCELRRERLKRKLIRLRKQLSVSNSAIMGFESAISDMNRRLAEIQSKRIKASLFIRSLLQGRELQTTRAWIGSFQRTVELEAVREELKKEIKDADEQTGKLAEIRRKMDDHLDQCRSSRDIIEILNLERERLEKERNRLMREMRKAESETQKNLRSLEAAENRVNEDRRKYQGTPAFTDGYQKASAQIEHMERAHVRHEREMFQLQSRIEEMNLTIGSCRAGVAGLDEAISAITSNIDASGNQISEMEANLKGLEYTFDSEKSTWKSIQERIDRLSNTIERIETDFETENRSAMSYFEETTQRIEAEQDRMESIRNELQSVGAQLDSHMALLDHQVTRSQELTRLIEDGRREFDETAIRAETESRAADSFGRGRQISREQEITERQEFMIHYAYGLHRALRKAYKP